MRDIALKSLAVALLLAPFAANAAPLQPGELSDPVAMAALKGAEMHAEAVGAHVCIAVLDNGGTLKAFHRMEGAAPGCVESAIAKARAAALYRIPTLTFMTRANAGEPALLALPGMVPLGGGVPAKSAAGVWLGAVGAAGSTNPNEVQIAQAGADAMVAAAK